MLGDSQKRFGLLSFHICFIALLVLSVYFQVRHHEFLTFDDDLYISQNVQVQKGLTASGVQWAFSSFYASNWHPLTWISHMLDVELFGMDSGWHHLMNLGIHLSNSLLLYLLLRYLFSSPWSALFIAAFFAIHPLHVESVAWAAERKDLLCAFFGFSALFSYAGFVRSGRRLFYLLSLVFFALSLLSKPMLVTLPILLVLFHFWPLQGDSWCSFQVLMQKIPFLLFALISSVVTLFAQNQGGSLASVELYSVSERCANAMVSMVGYMHKAVWPMKLAVFYPFHGPETWQTLTAFLFLVIVTCVCLWLRKTKPALLMGWLWFIVSLFPVIGIVQVGEQAMADRYSYIPLLGLLFMGKAFEPSLSGMSRKAMFFVLCALLVVYAFIAHRQTSLWQNQSRLFSHAVAVTENNYVAMFHLGNALVQKGDLEGARRQFTESLKIRESAKAHNNLAFVLERLHLNAEAILEYRLAIAWDPENQEALYNLGLILLKEFQPLEAILLFQKVVLLNPQNKKALANLQRAKRMVQVSR